jgi:photosystem II stability/assembly factor-like uncharacterized protein
MQRHLYRILSCTCTALIVVASTSISADNVVVNDDGKLAIPRVAAPAKQVASTDAMIWRFIGPMTGTRGSVVLGHPTDSNVFYHGASGGLWKTPDAGQTWIPVGDGQFKSSSVGAMEISESNPDIMYVGMGEPQMRNNVSWGDGVYKSVDGGETWIHLGLEDTHHIAQVRIHPTNPDIVYVAAYGHAFGPNEERGVFRTQDGGLSWEKVLYKSENAGVIDLVLNPANPDEMFASVWEFERKAWGPKTGGAESGLWKSTDGGDTWTDISKFNGLPEGRMGRIGITMSAADANRVYTLIDSETKPGLYRSDDLGENWTFVSDNFQIIGRPFYYSHIYANPSNADELWVPNNRIFSSRDAGKTWVVEPGIKDDFHDIWIDPKNANRMIATCDGGAQVTLTGGLSWSTQYSQKTSQLYRVATDNEFPYNVYGTVQDLLSYKVPSASRWGGISGYETTLIGNGETGDAIPDPDDNNIVFNISSGSTIGGGAPFTRNNIKTGQNEVRSIWPEPIFGRNASEMPYRFNWDTPFFISKYDSDTIYSAGNVVFRSTDEGLTWEAISGDLTRDLKEKQVIAGTPWLPEYFGQEIYSTIHRMAESPVLQGVIWVGSDDGLIHLTRNEGESWEDVSIPGLPELADVYEIEASPHDAAAAYVAISRYNTTDDYSPYLFKTSDYGKTWTDLSGSFPKGETTRTIREDPVRKGLLYVGTETGVFVSMDDGKQWQSINMNLPSVPVVDIEVKNADLVIATNGRGFWVLDDVTPIRRHYSNVTQQPAHLYPVSDHTRFGYSWWMEYAPGGDPGGLKKYFVQNQRPGLTYYELGVVNGEKKRKFVDAGDPKPLGVMLYFRLSEGADDVSLTIVDEQGNDIITHGKDAMTLKYAAAGDYSYESGLNRFVWDMRYPIITAVPGRPATNIRPFAKPGKYQARLTVDGVTQTQDFELFINPNEPYTREQTDEKFAFWMELYQNVEASTQDVLAALRLKEETAAKVQELKDSGAKSSKIRAAEEQAAVIAQLVDGYESTYVPVGRTLAEIINQPAKIFTKMIWLHNMMEVTEGPVSQPMLDVYAKLNEQRDAANRDYQKNISEAVEQFDSAIGN